ncbi:HEAT repeat domain-containing protein [Paenibacillus agricola]|uniref:Cyclic nucleotide-binding domain-containing protein n=1 Tax=Paenibacillus agricola TaxID=2716264 RepID=A0ABX0J8C8_9BACL|nr:HEAT repeat domain-containing protein [Paenibacillus agricola]NHN32402.1 cyclic nucleotide-binding domain-containing protein [Paenibacillus agricola]
MVGTLFRLLGLRAEDSRKLWVMMPVFYFAGIAELLSYTAFMALFNQRFGVQFLPFVYICEAIIIPLESWFLAKLAEKLPKARLMRTLYLIMTGILLINGLLLLIFKVVGIDFIWYYPILFISSNFVVRQLTLLLWSTAFDLCPTQQAKRLMPIFVGGATLGGVTAGFIAQQVGHSWGTEVVYILAPLFLIAGLFNFRKAIAKYLVPLTLKEDKQLGKVDLGADAADLVPKGTYYRQLVKSPFLLCAVGLMTLMPALYFLMEYQYFTTTEAVFPIERDLTTYYGMIITIQFSASLLLQTFSGRLMNWLGASNMLLAISIVFLAGFGLSALFLDTGSALAVVSATYALFYILLYYTAEPCYQLFFKMLPMNQRDGIRYVAQGIAASGGIVLGAGLALLHSNGYMSLAGVAIIGVVFAALLIIIAWFGRSLYIKELIKSVQSFQADLSEVAVAFLGGMRSTKVLQGVMEHLNNPNDHVREVALELVGKTDDVSFLPRLLELLHDDNPRIRIGALRAMSLQGSTIQELVQVAALLEDEEVDVRVECVRLIAKAEHLESQAHYFIRLKLLDTQPQVVAEGIKALYALGREESFSACDEAIIKMLDNGGEWAVYGCRTVADLGLSTYTDWIMSLLEDQKPAVRVAAVKSLGRLQYDDAIGYLLPMYPMADEELRKAIIQALIDMGDKGIAALLEGLQHPHPLIWDACVAALAHLLPEARIRETLVDSCIQRLQSSNREKSLSFAIAELGNAGLADLAEQRHNEIRNALCEAAWVVLAELTDERVVQVVRESVQDEDEELRENGLEVLAEGLGDRRLAYALLDMLKSNDEQAVAMEIVDPIAIIEEARLWSDDWLRDIAAHALSQEEQEDMPNDQKQLTMLDKVLFLKQVSLFSNISVDELGLIAGITREEVHPDQTFLLRQGETNANVYLIVEGNVELSIVSQSGGEGTLNVLGAKQVFGETTALDQAESSISAQAIFDDVRLLMIKGENLARLIRLYPEIGIGLLHASSARVRLLESMLMKMS